VFSGTIATAEEVRELASLGVGQSEIEYDQVDPREVGAHAREKLRGALDGERGVPGAQQRRGKAVPHERGIIGNDNGLGRRHAGRQSGLSCWSLSDR
jgi:hypothetical protein